MKVIFLDMNVEGLKVDEGVDAKRVCANWIENMIVVTERERHGQKGLNATELRFVAKITEQIEKTLETDSAYVELQDDQYNFVRRCMNDAKLDPQHAMVVSRVLDCLERSEDFNASEKKEG